MLLTEEKTPLPSTTSLVPKVRPPPWVLMRTFADWPFEQVIVPLEKQRNPAARRQARDTLDELARMSESVHRLMLRLVLRPHIEGS